MTRKIPWLHIVLFVLTFFTTVAAGAIFTKGVDPFSDPGGIWEGLPFSLTLMLILLSHELSHYFASRAHKTRATLPYFIPAPTVIGTFGAVIKMNSPIMSRKALIDIGASGPIVGFIVSVAACTAGLAHSEFIFVGDVQPGEGLGSSFLFSLLVWIIKGSPPEGYELLLHPVAFAGWVGLFVTFLNLIPVGQLDGGHLAYALLGRRHKLLSQGLALLLFLASIFYWPWALLAILMIVIGLEHPPVMNWESHLDPRRRIVGAVALIILLITFMPQPFIFPSQ